MARALSDDVKLALQRVGDGHFLSAADEYLAHHRLDALRRFGEVAVVHRHIAPAEHNLPLVLDRALDLVLAGEARGRVSRQEYHADTVLACCREFHPLLRHHLPKESIGNLDLAAGPVGELRIPAHGAPVGEIAQHGEALLDDRVRFLALDMGDQTHAAGVMFVCGVVQTLGFWAMSLNHCQLGRMVCRRRNQPNSALFDAGSWTIPAFPCCFNCLGPRSEASLYGTASLRHYRICGPASAHLGGEPRERVIDCARRYVGAKQSCAQALKKNEMQAPAPCLLAD